MNVYSRLNRPIVVSEYDPSWPQLFERERDRILAVVGLGSYFVGRRWW